MTGGPRERRAAERRDEPAEQDGPYGLDLRGTTERMEMRFLVPHEMAREADRSARANLKLGDVEADAPWYTTTYCDTADHRIYRAAERGTGSLLRLREYHSRRPECALLSRRIWIEWKDEGHERSRKQRLIVRPADVGPFLRGDSATTGRIELGHGARALFADGLRPVVVTQCRRVAYSSRRDDVRITFDHDLTYYAPEDAAGVDPTPCSLGPILAREPDIVVELKWQRTIPGWLAGLLAELRHSAADRPPKYVVAMRHLLSHPRHEHVAQREGQVG